MHNKNDAFPLSFTKKYYWYFEYGAQAIDEIYLEATQDSKAMTASNFAIATALDYLAAVAGGYVEGTQRTTTPTE